MSYTIAPSEDGKYIILTMKGKVTRKTAMERNIETHALGTALHINRYLVDVTEARNEDTIMGNYQFAYSDMTGAEGIDRDARVATLVSPDDHSHDFVEVVAQNVGLNVRLFTDREQAIRFLTDDHPPAKPGKNNR